MMIFGCPVGVRDVLKIARDQGLRIYHKFQPKPSGKVHMIYFSCAKDIGMLKISLNSLMRLEPEIIGKIYLVVDSKGPFTYEQEGELKKIVPEIEFHHLGKIDWASIDTLKTELKIFGIVADSAKSEDHLAKVDSDILFFNSAKLKESMSSAALFVGDGHYSKYKYAQGGLYLMRKSLAMNLSRASQAEILEAIKECGSMAEDLVVSALVRRRTDKIWLTRLMLFPDEYEKTNLSSCWVRKEFCSLHFVHRKIDMPEYARRLDIP